MKRFYENVGVIEVDGGWQVLLDGRGLKTVKGSQQIVPTRALAEALALEWAGQGDELDTSRFVMRDQTDFAIDIVRSETGAIIGTLSGFAETDTLCYRADPDEALYTHQLDKWEPLLTRLERREGIKFIRVSGIVHRPQPPETLAHLRQRLAEFDCFTLAALHTMASLASSLSIAMLALDEDAEPISLWRAASLEEEWQADLWGRDTEAEARRAKRQREFLAAFEFLQLLRS